MNIINTPIPDAPLAELQIFAAVAEARSFRAAATRLGVTPSALSHGLRKLESRLGVRLLNRTTRSVAPTEAGARLLATLTPALAEIRQAVGVAGAAAHTLQGQIRLTAPRAAAHLVLMPLIARFLAAHPRMRVELSCDDALVDIVAAGFDAGLRFGESLQADMVALPVGAPQRFAVVASPAYLTRHGAPTDPAQLTAHACINLRFPSGRVYAWQFVREGRAFDVRGQGAFTANDQTALLQAAEAGLGLAYTYADHAAPLRAQGRLFAVLDDWLPPAEQMVLYYPSRRLQPAGFQALLDIVRRGGADAALAHPQPPAG